MQQYMMTCASILVVACAPARAPVEFDLRTANETGISAEASTGSDAEYTPVPRAAAAILGCDASPTSPVCSIALPSAEEESAFRAEGARLSHHSDPRCRNLGAASIANEKSVRLYPKALVRRSGGETMYGGGHA